MVYSMNSLTSDECIIEPLELTYLLYYYAVIYIV